MEYDSTQGVVTLIGSVQTLANGVKQSKPKIWKVKRSKTHLQIRKSQGSSTVNDQPDTTSHQSMILHHFSQGSKDDLSGGQGLKFTVKFFDPDREC